jgi:hypothetical protein
MCSEYSLIIIQLTDL